MPVLLGLYRISMVNKAHMCLSGAGRALDDRQVDQSEVWLMIPPDALRRVQEIDKLQNTNPP